MTITHQTQVVFERHLIVVVPVRRCGVDQSRASIHGHVIGGQEFVMAATNVQWMCVSGAFQITTCAEVTKWKCTKGECYLDICYDRIRKILPEYICILWLVKGLNKKGCNRPCPCVRQNQKSVWTIL